jgi:hypothetical protein
MKTENVVATSTPASPEKKNESAKLASLLTLAAGAIAMPQSSIADIVITDMSGNPQRVGLLSSPSFTINNLPGTAQMRFRFARAGTTSSTSIRGVLASQVGGGYVRIKTNASIVVHVPAGFGWNQVAGASFHSGTVGVATYRGHAPDSYDHEYMLFKFQDSTQGNALRYGWVELGLANGNLISSPDNVPEVTIYRYAYDTTGAQLPTGQVPEPSPVALMVFGALTLGAKGLRSWRKDRVTASQS